MDAGVGQESVPIRPQALARMRTNRQAAETEASEHEKSLLVASGAACAEPVS
jgi:hypothetical protein